MAGLFALLNRSATGMASQRAVSATAGNNIANASTPGYARQRADLEALQGDRIGRAFIGGGVALTTVTQARDRFLESQMPGAIANASGAQAKLTVLTSVSTLDPGDEHGASAQLTKFYGALRELSLDPSDAGVRGAVVGDAKQLATSLNAAATDIERQRSGVDATVEAEVAEANQLASQIASLNTEIRSAAATGASPNDLRDARTKASDRLAELTGATPVPDGSGDLNFFLPSGDSVVAADRATIFSAVPDPANPGHLAVASTGTDRKGGGPLPSSALGGIIGGQLDARDGALQDALNDLDNFAFELASTLNGIHQSGFGQDGSTGRDFFTLPATAAGAARTIEVNAAIASDPSALATSGTAAGVPGNADALLAMLNTETTALPSGKAPSATVAKLISRYGGATSATAAEATQEAAVADHLSALRDSVSGVSIDEEMVSMTQAQRAFEAVAKVMQTTDSMLQTLLNLR